MSALNIQVLNLVRGKVLGQVCTVSTKRDGQKLIVDVAGGDGKRYTIWAKPGDTQIARLTNGGIVEMQTNDNGSVISYSGSYERAQAQRQQVAAKPASNTIADLFDASIAHTLANADGVTKSFCALPIQGDCIIKTVFGGKAFYTSQSLAKGREIYKQLKSNGWSAQ
jgi:hypothetical protein